jgi:hypothetical protein
MKFKDFEQLLKSFRSTMKSLSELYDIGFDFYEGKYGLASDIEGILMLTLNSHYKKEGVEWVEWFIFENDFGDKKMEAWEETKKGRKPICQTTEELWEYIKQYKK